MTETQVQGPSSAAAPGECQQEARIRSRAGILSARPSTLGYRQPKQRLKHVPNASPKKSIPRTVRMFQLYLKSIADHRSHAENSSPAPCPPHARRFDVIWAPGSCRSDSPGVVGSWDSEGTGAMQLRLEASPGK